MTLEVEPALGRSETGYLGRLSGLGLVERYCGLVSNASCFQSFGKRLPRAGRWIFDPARFVLNSSGSFSPRIEGWGGEAVPTVQMHYNESKKSRGKQVKSRGFEWSDPVVLICQPEGLRSHKVRMLCPWVLLSSLFITILAPSSCLHHSPSNTWGSASGCSFHCSSPTST